MDIQKNGIPMILTNKVGKGNVILFGFCMQDTYFQNFAKRMMRLHSMLFILKYIMSLLKMELYLIYIPPIQK